MPDEGKQVFFTTGFLALLFATCALGFGISNLKTDCSDVDTSIPNPAEATIVFGSVVGFFALLCFALIFVKEGSGAEIFIHGVLAVLFLFLSAWSIFVAVTYEKFAECPAWNTRSFRDTFGFIIMCVFVFSCMASGFYWLCLIPEVLAKMCTNIRDQAPEHSNVAIGC